MIDPYQIEAWKRDVRDYWEPSAGEAITRLIDEYDALLAERKEMLSVLRDVEWAFWRQDAGSCCPVCRGANHTPDCRLAALLKGDP